MRNCNAGGRVLTAKKKTRSERRMSVCVTPPESPVDDAKVVREIAGRRDGVQREHQRRPSCCAPRRQVATAEVSSTLHMPSSKRLEARAPR
jgi:hypothetical protein